MRALSALTAFLAVPVFAQVPVAKATVHTADWAVEELASDELFAGCSLACALGWEVVASSHLSPQGANRYDADQLDDASAQTAWVEGADGPGVGESVVFRLIGDPEHDVGAVGLWGLRVVNGYGKSEAAWRENGRVRTALLLVNGWPAARIELADTMLMQSVSLPDGPLVRAGDVVTLVVTDVYPGDLYEDLAISEIILDGAH
ncbi:NADase-type glycan-binding domain-containing protein [Rubrivirga sp.]|uniref:NADase-type glycan-binding domain-containing protein n=1 Tax=Rubrivirga sp. TaxID=1885344 RepID=UPI003B52934A